MLLHSREICIIFHNNNKITIASGVDLFFIYNYFHVPNILIISSEHLPITRQFQNMIWCYVLVDISQKVVDINPL